MARKRGLFIGLSAGAAIVAAIDVAKKLDSGVVVVVMPDGGARYLSMKI